MSEQPQEWKPEYVEKELLFVGCLFEGCFKKIADAHNAALAAERDRIWREAPNYLDIQEAVVAKLNLVSREQELEQQLAAERTNAKMYCDENIKLRGKVCKCEVIHRHAETIELLKQQLDAEREAAKKLCELYFNIPAEAIGEDEVRRKRDDALNAGPDKVAGQSSNNI